MRFISETQIHYHFTQVEGQNLIDYKNLVFYFWEETFKYYRTSCVVHVFCGLMTVCLKTPRNFSLPWKYHEEKFCFCIVAMFLISLPSSFHYVSDAYIFIIHFSKLSLMTGTIQALTLTEKCTISFSRYLHILFTLILS